MSNQEKKEWLSRYREAEAEAVRLDMDIVRLRSRAERMTTTIGQLPGGGNGGRSMESAIAAVDELAVRFGENQLEALRIRREIEEAIAAVTDGRLRMLLRYRYIDGMKWERIAGNMGFQDVRQAYRVHGTALEKILVKSLNVMFEV